MTYLVNVPYWVRIDRSYWYAILQYWNLTYIHENSTDLLVLFQYSHLMK